MELQPLVKSSLDAAWKILIIDDDEDDFIIAREMLAEARGRKYAVHWAATYEAGRKEILAGAYNAVLVDYDLGLHSGIELIREAIALKYAAPLILFTGRGNYEVDVEAMEAGATLYLTKNEANPLLLERAIRYAIELKQKEQALKQAEEKFSKAFLYNPVALTITRLSDGRYLEVNEAFYQLTGHTPEAVIGRTVYDIRLYADPEKRAEMIHLIRTRGSLRNYEITIRTSTGAPRTILTSIDPMEIAGELCILTTFIDITERKQTEQALRESEARLRDFLENTHEIIFILDRDWRFQYINRNYAEILHTSPEALAGKTFWEAFPGYLGTPVEQHYRKVMDERVPVQFEMGGVYSPFFFDISVYPTQEGIGVFAVDRTEEQRSREALEDFVSVASHDLQEPLRKIILFGNSLRDLLGSAPNASAGEYLRRMQNAAERMQTMITGLLELTRVSTRGESFTQVDLNHLAAEVVSDLDARIHSAGGQVQIEDLPAVRADALQMRQLFQNLIGNAIKFHQPGVPPVVRVSGEMVAGKNPPVVEIRVTDNGVGFDQEHAGRIFQPFQRLHGRSEYEGTGLGLAICRKIVERHHGTISVQSTRNQGTTFTIKLPAEQVG